MIGAPSDQFRVLEQREQSTSTPTAETAGSNLTPSIDNAKDNPLKGSFYEQAQQRLHLRLQKEREILERRLDQLDQLDFNSKEQRQRLQEYIANPSSLTAVSESEFSNNTSFVFPNGSTDATSAPNETKHAVHQDSLQSLLDVVLEREPSGGAIDISIDDITMGKHKSLSNRSLELLGPTGALSSGNLRDDSWVSRGSVDRQGSVDSFQLADFLGNTFDLKSEEFGSWSARVRTRLWKKYWRNERKNIQCFPSCEEFGDYRESRTDNNEHSRNPPSCKGPLIVQLTVPSLGFRYGDILVIAMVRDVEDKKNSRVAYTEEDLVIEEKEFGAVRGILSDGGDKSDSASARRGTLASESEWVILPRGLQKWSYTGKLSKVRVAKKDKDTKKSTEKRQTLAVVVEVLCRTSAAASVLDSTVVGSDYVVATRTMSNVFELSTTRTLMRELESAKSDSATESSSGKSSKSKSSKSNKSSSSKGKDGDRSGSSNKKKKRSDRDKSIAPSIEPRSRKMTRFEEVKQAGRKLFFNRIVELPDERDLNAIEEDAREKDESDSEESEGENQVNNRGDANTDSKDQEVMRRAQDLQNNNNNSSSVAVNSKREEETTSYPATTSPNIHVQLSSVATDASRSAPTDVHVGVGANTAADFMVRFLDENDLGSLSAPLFAHGYDSLRRLAHVTESDMMEMDVLPGHRRHLLALIRDGEHERFGGNKEGGSGVSGDAVGDCTLAAKRAHEHSDRMLLNLVKMSTVRRGVFWVSGLAAIMAFALVVIVLTYSDAYAEAFGMNSAAFTALAVFYSLSTASLFYASRYILLKTDPDNETRNQMMSLMKVSQVVCCVVSVSLTATLATMWVPIKAVVSKPLWMLCMFLSTGVGTGFLVAAVCLVLLGRREKVIIVQVRMEEAHEAVPVV